MVHVQVIEKCGIDSQNKTKRLLRFQHKTKLEIQATEACLTAEENLQDVDVSILKLVYIN